MSFQVKDCLWKSVIAPINNFCEISVLQKFISKVGVWIGTPKIKLKCHRNENSIELKCIARRQLQSRKFTKSNTWRSRIRVG